jgi:hypothetical protein
MADDLFRILKEEFGITSERELDAAIQRQGFINLAPFCPLKKEEERACYDE